MRMMNLEATATTTWRAKRALRVVALHRFLGAVRPGTRTGQT